MSQAKPFCISKNEVWEAYQRVKANKGAAGVDDESIEDFEKNVKDNLYKVWNRMSSGSYLPPPVRTVKIPKKNGGERKLGIPTVADRIAQQVAKARLEPELEPLFHADSYGYRPGKSALDAVGQARERCWRNDWVLDLDIKGFFDNLDQDLLMRAVRKHAKDRWVVLFRPRRSKNRKGKFFINFSPAVSNQAAKEIRDTIRSWKLPQRSDKAIEDLSPDVQSDHQGLLCQEDEKSSCCTKDEGRPFGAAL